MSVNRGVESYEECFARIDRIETMISRKLESRENAAVRFAATMEKPVATYFGLDDEASAEFCLWLVDYLLQDQNEHPHE